MKKLLAILISIFLAVSFTGCNQDDDESTSTETVTGTQGETKPTESGNTSQGETKPTESENTSQGETKPAEGENTSQEETKPAEGENTSQEETKPTESETISLADTHWSSADTVITDETGLTTVTIEEQMYFCFRSLSFFWYDVTKDAYQNALDSLALELSTSEKTSASKKLSRSLYDSGDYTVEGRTIKFSESSYSNAAELTLSEDLQSFVLTEIHEGTTYKTTFNRLQSSPAPAVVTMTLNPKDDTSEIVGYWVLSNTITNEFSGLKFSIQKPQYIVCDENAGKIFSFDNVKFMEELTKYKQSQNTEAYSVDIPYSTETDSIAYFKIGSKITIASMDSEGNISYLIGTLSEDKKSITIPLEDEEDGTTEIIYTKVETVPENAKLTIEVLPTSSEPAADTSPSLNISSMNLNLLGKGK